MALYYPPVGFHFLVHIVGITDINPFEVCFQEVSGLTQEIGTEDIQEGGENRFSHKLPLRGKYNNLVLKRGMFIPSLLVKWCKDAVENFSFEPHDVMVFLLNELHIPLAVWSFTDAYPVKLNVSDFKAQDNSIVIETIELAYKYYRRII